MVDGYEEGLASVERAIRENDAKGGGLLLVEERRAARLEKRRVEAGRKGAILLHC